MMVTFISQCEKNALKKTRRVLDAFANRIGDNTWQTLITEEGLNTVKKMLRQTASKSTAVSCHWIRSRSRSQFLWVVGNKSKFDEQGVVPVNSTSNQIIIGDIQIMTDQIFANTKGQRLDQHLFAVGYLAHKIIKQFVPANENLAQAVFIAGCWHDMGKIDPAFQVWLNKLLKKNIEGDIPDDGQHIDKGTFSWQNHPRHNEISLLLFQLLFDGHALNEDVLDSINHAIYWHHAKPLRKKAIDNLVGIYDKLQDFDKKYVQFTSSVVAILKSVKNMMGDSIEFDALNLPKLNDIEDRLESRELPTYKRYKSRESLDKYNKSIQRNALNNLARSALITADRLVSKNLSGDALNARIVDQTLDEIFDVAFQKDRGLKQHIKQCLDGFNQNNPDVERNREQAIAAKKLADEEVTIGVLRGPAGCGKTKIALEWALNTGVKRIFWVCPRVQICEGLFKDLQSKEYLPNANVEICTGEIKQILVSGKPVDTPDGAEFLGDIVITTIDQIVNAITTHRNVTTLMEFMNSHVVFDEYHEYITMPAFNLLFSELVECKRFQKEDDKSPNALLVSATPNPLFVREFLRIPEQDIVGIPSFNKSLYKINFAEYDEKIEDEKNPFFQLQPANTFVISNTAITAQKSFIDNQGKENGILLHSKFKKSDRVDLFGKAFDAFKENGSRGFDILRSGPVVQAALNITCDKMISEMTHAENFLQRLGRLDRFGKKKTVNEYVIAITDAVKNGKAKGGSSSFLHQLNSLQSTKAWFDFLQNELPEDKQVTIDQIYDLYDRFYRDGTSCQLIEQDLVAALRESVIRIDQKLIDPVTLPSNKKEENKIKIKKHSLRGDSRFVQMAVCNVNDRNEFDITNDYAYSEEHSEESFSYGVEAICGHGVSAQNLLSFMANKHHNIKPVKKAYKDSQLLNEARNPETPIYLSYTPADLKQVEAQPHSYAIYYAMGIRQPIGAISIKQLNNGGD